MVAKSFCRGVTYGRRMVTFVIVMGLVLRHAWVVVQGALSCLCILSLLSCLAYLLGALCANLYYLVQIVVDRTRPWHCRLPLNLRRQSLVIALVLCFCVLTVIFALKVGKVALETSIVGFTALLEIVRSVAIAWFFRVVFCLDCARVFLVLMHNFFLSCM